MVEPIRRMWRGSPAVVALALIAAACGGGDSTDTTTVAITTATTQPTETVPPTSNSTPGTTAAAGSPGAEVIVLESDVTVNGVAVGRGSTQAVGVGDEISVAGAGEAVLRLGGTDASTFQFELFKGGTVTLSSLELPEVEAFLEAGHFTFTIRDAGNARLKLDTGNAIFTTLEPSTQFTVCQAGQGGGTCIHIEEGEVEWDGQGVKETFVAGRSAFAEWGEPAPSQRICVPDDAFATWLDAARRGQDDRALATLVGEFEATACPGEAPATTTTTEAPFVCAGLCAHVEGVEVVDGELVITWTAHNFEPDVGNFHAHFYYGIYAAEQVGTNNDSYGVAQGSWELTDDQPFRTAGSSVAIANLPAGTEQLCVVAADSGHGVVNPENHECIDIPAELLD